MADERQALGQVLSARSRDRRACRDVERGDFERAGVGEDDRQGALLEQELRSRDVDGASLLQRADGVHPAGREVTEREGERAHDP